MWEWNVARELNNAPLPCAVFEYPRHMVSWTLDYCNSYQNGWSIEFQGDAGTPQLEVTGFRVY